MAREDEKGDMSVSEAGKKGGQQTSDTHGQEFYSEIGHKGGEKGNQQSEELLDMDKDSEDKPS